MTTLPVPAPAGHALPTYAGWLTQAFARLRRERRPEGGSPGRRLLERTEATFGVFEGQASETMLLHGDLHHKNSLYDAQHGWVAIDPRRVLGPACLEVGRFLHNQLPSTLPPAEKRRLPKSGSRFSPQDSRAAANRSSSVCWSSEH